MSSEQTQEISLDGEKENEVGLHTSGSQISLRFRWAADPVDGHCFARAASTVTTRGTLTFAERSAAAATEPALFCRHMVPSIVGTHQFIWKTGKFRFPVATASHELLRR